jgi:hypothetical protein
VQNGRIIDDVKRVDAVLYREVPSELGQEIKVTFRFFGFQIKIRIQDFRNMKTPTRLQRSVELIRLIIISFLVSTQKQPCANLIG